MCDWCVAESDLGHCVHALFIINSTIDCNAGGCYHFFTHVALWRKVLVSLSVRNLDEDTVAQLRIRAARHGVSMEEEVRQIIKRAAAAPESLGDLAVRLFSPAYGDEELVLPKRETSEPLEFPE